MKEPRRGIPSSQGGAVLASLRAVPIDCRRSRGFTMIEVMVAILLTAVAVIGISALYRVATRSSSFTRHNTEAAVLAEDKREWLRTQLSPIAGSDTPSELAGTTSMYTRQWTVTTNANWIDYQVDVTWTEDGDPRVVSLRSKRGL